MLNYIEIYNKKKDESSKKINVIRQKINELQNEICNLEKECNAIKTPSWISEIIIPLAEELARIKGLNYKIFGPFGIKAEISIYLMEDIEKDICNQNTWSISIVPGVLPKEGLRLFYYTGKKTNKYASGTMGEMNGMNNERMKLPDSIEEICDLLSFYEQQGVDKSNEEN